MAESHRYRLRGRAFFRGTLHRAGDEVEAEPHELGPNFEMIEGEHYPDNAKPPEPAPPRSAPVYSETDPNSTAYNPGVATLIRLVEELKERVEKLERDPRPVRRPGDRL